jgi:lactoylglutathione lyase
LRFGTTRQKEPVKLGAFSVSLAVKDLQASRQFYENLGFTVCAGDQSQNWLILKNGGTVIGLFQGMFEKNILTFNPGWNSDAQQGVADHSLAPPVLRLQNGS